MGAEQGSAQFIKERRPLMNLLQVEFKKYANNHARNSQ
jgi:hypothetical protein